MKHIIILFGEMGCGKNYWGERIAKDRGYIFFDGDHAAPPAMVEKVTRFQLLSREQILHFVRELCIVITEKASAAESGIVVAQALYFDEDRKYMAETLGNLGYRVTFQWVRPPFWRNIRQIYSRPQGSRWVLYWLRNKYWFEQPTHDHDIIGR